MHATLRRTDMSSAARQLLTGASGLPGEAVDELVDRLATHGIATGPVAACTHALTVLARNGMIRFAADGAQTDTALIPCRWDFSVEPMTSLTTGQYKLARLAYLHAEDGHMVARHPAADCYLTIADGRCAALLSQFYSQQDIAALVASKPASPVAELCGLFARAGVIQACDAEGRTLDETAPERRQWDFHDALFHSRSRLGRTDTPIGGTWRFKGQLPQAPAIKAHNWTQTVITLERPDLVSLMRSDLPLTQVIEARKSVRHNSIVPLTSAELGAFLYRTVRIRERTQTADGDFTSRPYPGGGAIYENEIYVTVDRCADLPRGFYYYDPSQHALCLISRPDWQSEGLLEEARTATAGICRPQILLTIASRHARFSWKYSGMAYAAQLKNVGVIYQTMYLVATAMGIGGCALGLGNTDRFLAMTGLSWFEEGSVGEFLIGRPL